LNHGPDLGGLKSIGLESLYLPAWKRYEGRTYTEIDEQAWQQHLTNPRAKVLIMSGLYGLIDPAEMIQNYDIHLSDTDNISGQDVKSMWQRLYTDTTLHYINRAYRGGRRVKIFNLLCDINYVTAIQWIELPREKCTVYHLASPVLKGKDLLSAAGTVANRLLRDPERMDLIPKDSSLRLSDFGEPPPKMSGVDIIFERRFGDSQNAEA
jgi:hypothetical protein